ncbi:unnamed protein product [Rhizophagus irregularis]|uniref:Uncharacterized protein n=1 Tax=Rhizophagus irregularis TaxID=588596 RepID=A0A915ZVN7_9GLOM|nr:unnamed protein product [Rhizophagus irregularis]
MQNVVQVMVIQLIHVFLKVKTKEFYFFSLKESSTIKESSRIQHKKNSISVKSRKIGILARLAKSWAFSYLGY